MQNSIDVSEAAMNHVRWETLSECSRQLISHLATAPEFTVIEQDGAPKFRVMVFQQAQPTKPNIAWTSEENNRRCDLIEKELDGQLTPEEQVELEALQTRVSEYVNAVAPLPLEKLRQLYQQLLDKAAQANGSPS